MSGDDTGDTGRLTLCRRDGDDAGADDNESEAEALAAAMPNLEESDEIFAKF